MKNKSEANTIKRFVKQAQKMDGHSIRFLRTDNGTEFVNKNLTASLEQMGIQHQRIVSYTPEQSDYAEKKM